LVETQEEKYKLVDEISKLKDRNYCSSLIIDKLKGEKEGTVAKNQVMIQLLSDPIVDIEKVSDIYVKYVEKMAPLKTKLFYLSNKILRLEVGMKLK
jgi:hypothetical protein